MNEKEKIHQLTTTTKALIQKLKDIHESPEYQAVWFTAHNHNGPYKGMNYVEELVRVEDALRAMTP